MPTPGRRTRRRGPAWVLSGLLILLALFLLQELAAGLLPDIYKGFAGESRRALVAGAVIAFAVVGLLLYIVHLRTLVPDDDVREVTAEERVRARTALLHAVRRTWTEGADRSWERTVRVELGLAEHRAAVHDPWGPPRLTSGAAEGGVPLDAGTRLVDVFARHHGQLLVLGAPGAGKTSRMLELTEALIEAADRDATAPAPAFLLLTNWHGEPFERWVLDELHNRYRVPRETGLALLRNNEIALVLDGLDEVAPQLRTRCVRGINALLSAEQHPHCPLAVSCRSADYDALDELLTVNGAVSVQPLEIAAVHALLNGAGGQLRGLAAAAAADPVLARLLTTPLMLGVAVFAYEGVDEDEVAASGDTEERRGRIFDAYIDRMIHRDRTLRSGRIVPGVRAGEVRAGEVRAGLLRFARILSVVHATVYYADDPTHIVLQAPEDVVRRLLPRSMHLAFRLVRAMSGYEAGNPDSRPNWFYVFLLRFFQSGVLDVVPFLFVVAPEYMTRRFLDYVTDRAILRRAGNGYAFLHKTIQDHLAAQAGRMSARELRALARSD
ncbi:MULTISPECIES: NACHT domain-containing protein [unclassified Streptomyces]|uniref:NACHT domain-containing protein n=1 Tax=unclassified Streptomyces TaxID=2593676 RepID=UPI0036E90A48